MKISSVSLRIAEGILNYLKNSHQESLLPEIIEALRDRLSSPPQVTVVSPVNLSDAQKEKARRLVLRLIPNAPSAVEFKTDTAILDGLKIIAGDTVFDLTLAGKIDQLKESLG